MKLLAKIALVAAGYVAALLVAALVVTLYMAATDGPQRQASGGMFAFGDSLLFLGVFGLAALPASGAALFFLRPLRWLWRILSIGALTVAATGLGALASSLAPQNAGAAPFLAAWSSFSPLRVLLAPPLAMAFGLAGLFAPTRTARFALLGAAGIEAIVLVSVMLIWFNPFR